MNAMLVVAWVIAVAWVWKAMEALRGMPRVPNLRLPEFDVWPAGEPRVAVLVPARDEAGDIAACLMSLLAQDYTNLKVIAIDDRSSDATGAIMDELAQESQRLSVMHVAELPEGWLGKTHAMAMGARQAIAMHQPEYLLFTDADVIFRPQAIRRALAQAVGTQADHFVLLPSPILRTVGEAALLGFMQVMGLLAVRPWRVADATAKRDAIGVGAFNLLRAQSYLSLGGFDALRMQIVEDVILARRVKRLGMRQRMAVGPGMVTLHWAAGAMGVVKVMTKNMFAVFAFRPAMLLGAGAWIVIFWLGPVVGLGFAATRVPAVVALIAIAAMYFVARRMGGISVWTAVASPVSAVLILYSMLRSMVVTLRDGGVTWRGTFYPLAELRRSVER